MFQNIHPKMVNVTIPEHLRVPPPADAVQVLPPDQLHLDVLRGILPAQTPGQHFRGREESGGHPRHRMG